MIEITPTLFVGLGGAGARALLRSKQCYIDAYGMVPPMVAFLAIDTDDSLGTEVIKSNAHGDITLAENEVLSISSPHALAKYNVSPEKYAWIPPQNVSFLNFLRGSGTGRVRSSGRFILLDNINAVKTALEKKLQQIFTASNFDGVFSFATYADGIVYPAIVNVVSSIAGGTGGGMIVDMLHIIPSTLDTIGYEYCVYPWILMPDVYGRPYPRMMDHVYSNAYGAIRELDYLFHMSLANNNPLTLGNDKVYHLSDRIRYAYLINNFNDLVDEIKSPNDMADSIGRSMFLHDILYYPSNAIVIDPLLHLQSCFDLRADGKRCWCASVGSAELVYDSQKVGDCIGYATIRSVAKQLCTPATIDITDTVMQWMSSPDVNILKEQGIPLFDSLLSDNCPAEITLKRDTQSIVIDQFIERMISVEEELNRNYAEIKNRVISELNKKVIAILNTPHGVGDADAFLKRLQSAIDASEVEMRNEIQEHRNNADCHEAWSSALSGIRGRFFGVDEEKRDALCQAIYNNVRERRNIARKQYALNVYSELKQSLAEQSLRVSGLKSRLKDLQEMMSSRILKVQQDASAKSLYKVNLHLNDVNAVRVDEEGDSLAYIQVNQVSDLLNTVNEVGIFDIMKPWADRRMEVQSAFGKSLNYALEELHKNNPSLLVETFEYLKKMSSPMWKVDYEGKVNSPMKLINYCVIGCGDVYNNIFENHPEYAQIFSTDGTTKPDLARHSSWDRIQLLTVSCFAPVYAVKNTSSYKAKFEEMSPIQAGYLDEIWNQRMLNENFQLTPECGITGPDPLQIWVKSIILKIVNYDVDKGKYLIKSRNQGRPLDGYLFDLGANREVAYETFKSMNLHLEAKDTINGMVSSKGKNAIQNEFDAVTDDNYYLEYSQMSDKDKDHIEQQPAYKMLEDLMNSEIELVSQGLSIN